METARLKLAALQSQKVTSLSEAATCSLEMLIYNLIHSKCSRFPGTVLELQKPSLFRIWSWSVPLFFFRPLHDLENKGRVLFLLKIKYLRQMKETVKLAYKALVIMLKGKVTYPL